MDSNAGTLYVVATPIGNLEDLSPRAVKILSIVDLIACEDTRHTRKLLTHFSIQTHTTSYHEHNEESKAATLLDQMCKGKQIALVSDAGTPLLSDPGYRLVRCCRQKEIPVLPIPGPFAGAAACSVSGRRQPSPPASAPRNRGLRTPGALGRRPSWDWLAPHDAIVWSIWSDSRYSTATRRGQGPRWYASLLIGHPERST